MSLKRFVTLTLAAVLLAAGPAAAQSVLRIGLNDDPDALDPTISRAYTGRLVFAALCDKLFDVTPDLKIVPQLATSYEWAPDQRSVVLKLRPGVKFHDGEPFNAEAVTLQHRAPPEHPGLVPQVRDRRDQERRRGQRPDRAPQSLASPWCPCSPR